MSREPRIDAYIAAAKPFAQPILTELRDRIHAACPEAAEIIKWSSPHFDYRGKPLCNMAAFTEHAAFGFWRGKEIVTTGAETDAMGQFGKIRSLDDLPDPAAFRALVLKAMALTDSGAKAQRPLKHAKPEIETPAELIEAFEADSALLAHWDAFPPSARRDYMEWIVSAKRPETRTKRVETTLAQVAEGKKMNWQYESR